MPLIYNLLEKAYVNFRAYAEKKMIWQKKREIAKKLTKKWKIKVIPRKSVYISNVSLALTIFIDSIYAKVAEQ